MRKVLIAALALFSSPALTATAPAEPVASKSAAVSQAMRATAHALAQTTAPHDTMVRMNMLWAERGMLALPQNNPKSKSLEEDYPGIHQAMWNAAEPELRRQMEVNLPKLWASLEDMYVQQLTNSQLVGLLKFYRTPTGQRLIRGLYGNLALSGAVDSIGRAPKEAIDPAILDKASAAARKKTVSQINPDPADIRILQSAISVDKMRAVGAKVQQLTFEWSTAIDADDDKRTKDLMQKAALEYSRAHPNK